MIRFPNRKAKHAELESSVELDAIDVDLDELELTGDELELMDDDFVLLEAAPPEPPLSRSILRAALAAVPDGTSEARRMDVGAPEPRPISKARLDTLRTKAQRASSTTMPPAPVSMAPASAALPEVAREVRRAPTPRVSLDAEAESSVADECLASIAAVASHARASSPLIEDLARGSSSMPIASLVRSSERSPVDDLLDAVPVPRSSQRSPVDALLDAAPVDVLPRGAASRSSTATVAPSSSSILLASRLPAVRPPPLLGSLPASSSFRSAYPSVPGLLHAGGDDAAETLPVPSGRSSLRRLGEVRSETAPLAHAGADDAAETLPVPPGRSSLRRLGEVRSETAPLFARTSTGDRSAPAPSQSGSSVAPVAVASAEPTVIVVRDRPRTAWVIAAAAIGALAAVTAMRFASPREATAAAPAMTTPAAGNAPPAPAPAPASAVVQFGEEDGVSIDVPVPASSAPVSSAHAAALASAVAAPSHVARPATQSSRERSPGARPSRPLPRTSTSSVSAPTPLPDGSLGLASTGTAPVTTAAPALAPLPVPQPPARKRVLTPEQELAEAQLRAATR